MNPVESWLGTRVCAAVRRGWAPGTDLRDYRWSEEQREGLMEKQIEGAMRLVLENGESVERTWVARIQQPVSSWNGRVLWYLHGTCNRGDFTEDLSGRENFEVYRRLEKGKPILVTISLGDFWLLDDSLRPQFQAVMREVLEQALPEGTDEPAVRHWLMGISMGGLNGLQLLMFDETAAFGYERAVFVAPYRPRCDPFDLKACVACLGEPIAEHRRESRYLHRKALKGIRLYFSEEEWARCDPIGHAARGGFSRVRDRVLLAWGPRDAFGFDVKAAELQRLAGFAVAIDDEPELDHRMPQAPENLARIAAFLEAEVDAKERAPRAPVAGR